MFSAKQPPWVAFLVALFVAGLCWGALFHSTGLIGSGFHLIDEHVLVDMTTDLDRPDSGLFGVARQWVTADLEERRFRPLYYLSRVLRAEVFGLHWPAWACYNAALAALTGAALFAFGRLVGFPALLSGAFAGLATLGPPSTVWWRLGTPETEGNPLIAVSMLLLAWFQVRPRDRRVAEWLALASAVLASLMKEGIILFLPALAVLRVWLAVRLRAEPVDIALRHARAFIVAIAAVVASELMVLAFAVGTAGTGYAGVDAHSFEPARVWASIRAVDRVATFWIPALAVCVVLFALVLRRSRRRSQSDAIRDTLLAWIVFAVAALPQVLLYTKSGWAEHYFNPLAIASALLLVTAVDSLRTIHRGIYLVFIVLALMQVHNRFQWTRRHAQGYATEGTALWNLLATTRHCTAENDILLIVANPRVHYEEADSLRTYLQFVIGRPRIYLATVGSHPADILSAALVQQEQARAFLNPRTLGEHYFQGQTMARLDGGHEPPAALLVLSPERLFDAFAGGTADWIPLGRYHPTDFDVSGVRMRLYCRAR